MHTTTIAPRVRQVRRPFYASRHVRQHYRLPRGADELAAAALQGFRNRAEAWGLFVFLCEAHATPAGLLRAFPVDRRALAGVASIGLTEGQIRGAIATLEAAGLIVRAITVGNGYQRKHGELRRMAVLWRFGADIGPVLLIAVRRAVYARAKAAERRSLSCPDRRPSVVQIDLSGKGRVIGSVEPDDRRLEIAPEARERALAHWQEVRAAMQSGGGR